MTQSNPSHLKQLATLYFELKRLFYQWRYPNLLLAKGVRIRHQLGIRGGAKVTIGEGTRIGMAVHICGSGEVTIGSHVSLNGCWIGCDRAITIGDDCLISDCFIIDTDYHNLEPHLRHCPPGPKVTAPITIGRNVWIGARATVMKGVQIGDNSVIGLGSIVRKSVPANVVVIGNPQQIVKQLDVSPTVSGPQEPVSLDVSKSSQVHDFASVAPMMGAALTHSSDNP